MLSILINLARLLKRNKVEARVKPQSFQEISFFGARAVTPFVNRSKLLRELKWERALDLRHLCSGEARLQERHDGAAQAGEVREARVESPDEPRFVDHTILTMYFWLFLILFFL